MSKFYKLRVAEIKVETPDCVSLSFEVPPELQKEFNFIQGQHLNLKLLINGQEIRRSYSICSSPVINEPLRVASKRLKDGIGSNFINDKIRKGDMIEVMTPMGNFHTELKITNRKHYVLFAGGSGITPMLSIVRTTLIAEPQSKITLFYGNFNEEYTIFKKVLDETASQYKDRFIIYYLYEKPGVFGYPSELTGIMTKEKVKELVNKKLERNPVIEYFICGPGPMMDNVKQVLEDNNVNRHFIHIEYFTTIDEPGKETLSIVENVTSDVTVIMDGRETSFILSSRGAAILDAAIEAGVDAPFSCKGAVCATCRAKLLEGKVKMEMNYALTDGEIEEGYILTCQSHPITPNVTVDYDQG